MKIVALHTDFRLYWPARLKYLSQELNKRGDLFTVIEIAGKGSPYAFAKEKNTGGLDWICLFPDNKIEEISPLIAKAHVIDKLNDLNPDVVVAGAIAFTSGAAAVDWAKKNNRAVVIFDDSKKEGVKRNFFVNSVKRIIYAHVDAILCPAQDWLSTYSYWGIKKDAVFYGVDVVDNSFWKTKAEMRSNEKPYFLCVGRLIDCKRFDTVITAFNELSKTQGGQVPSLKFVGGGPEEKKLKELVSKEAEYNVSFLPFCSQEQLRKIYNEALVLILPSKSETWGLVVNEAMASGLPVIVSKECGCSSVLVAPCENGYVFSSGDVADLKKCMISMMNLSKDDLLFMKKQSLNIINDWDLSRFSLGAISAIDYASRNKRKPFYFLTKYLLKKWNGRYNPI